ncbi:polyprotein [Weldona virus]|nr:polyprotein [Weldona virus]
MSLLILCLILSVSAMPQKGTVCFNGGTIVQHQNSDHGISEFCVRDDISTLRSTSIQVVNQSKYNNVVYRMWNVKNWHKCNPVETTGGTFTVFEVDKTLTIIPKTYACRAECQISVDKEFGQIILHSENMNHYVIDGTLTKMGWFKGKTSIAMSSTCEHISIRCGMKEHSMHACFKTHMPCVRALQNTMIPGKIAHGICSNAEIIVVTTMTLLGYAILILVSGTWFIFILIPVFAPFTYIYGKLYDKACKICKICGLPYHPFRNCGTTCVCGAKYQSTDKLRVHRDTFCKGYKPLRAARLLCRNKGSNFILAIGFSVLFFSFISPISGQECLTPENLPEIYLEVENALNHRQMQENIILICIMSIVIVSLIFIIMNKTIFDAIIRKYVYKCHECEMYHMWKGLTFNGDFTNKCETCICGFEPNHYTEVDYTPPLVDMHKMSKNCLYKLYRLWSKISNLYIVSAFLFIALLIPAVKADPIKDCINKPFGTKRLQMIDCIGPNLVTTECNSVNKESIESIFTTLKGKYGLKDDEKSIFKILDSSLDDAFRKIEYSTNPHFQVLSEVALYAKYCDYHKKMKLNTGYSQVGFRAFMKAHKLELCAQKSYKSICNCMENGHYCKSTGDDWFGTTRAFYADHNQTWSPDVMSLLEGISMAFRGITTSMIADAIGEQNIQNISNIVSTLIPKAGVNQMLNGVLQYTKFVLDLNQTELEASPYWMGLQQSIRTGRSFSGVFEELKPTMGTKKKTCQNAKIVECKLKTDSEIVSSWLACEEQGDKSYALPNEDVIWQEETTFCVGDAHCHKDFAPVDGGIANGFICRKKPISKTPSIWNEEIKSCSVGSRGTCKFIDDSKWEIVKCMNGHYYLGESNIAHSGADEVNDFCITKKCLQARKPINPSFLSECVWDQHIIKSTKSQEVLYKDIEAFRHAIESKIEEDLNSHSFLPMANMPKLIPRYSPITIQGAFTEEGVQSSYIEGETTLIAGMSNGFNVYTPEGDLLFDIIIYVKKAEYISSYNKVYETGPTININLKHSEQCTGQCPQTIPADAGWMTFSKEHTSNWGCEEFGCLAIGSGCLYGSCRDVIRPEMEVFEKVGSDEPRVDICVTLPHKTFCARLEILEATTTDTIEVTFSNTESNEMPQRIAFKQGKVLTGNINPLGNYMKACGNVQQVGRQIFGQGVPSYDYICHAAKRKDVIVRKCYDNNYVACSQLKEDKNIVFKKNGTQIITFLTGKRLGTLKYVIKLGDFSYKTYKKEIDIIAHGKCAGNTMSISGIYCQIRVDTEFPVVCKIESNCELFQSTMNVSPEVKEYNLKMKCNKGTSEVKIKICNSNVETISSLHTKDELLDIAAPDQTHYVQEEDLRCKTWLCKVKDEGISVIFGPIKAFLGHYIDIAYYIFIGLILMFLIIYIFIPMGKKLAETLKDQNRALMLDLPAKIK